MFRNTPTHWGVVAQVFHWFGGALVFYLLGHGWWMTHLAARDERLGHFATHASVGYFLLGLVIVRMVWRWANAVPPHPAGAPAWEKAAAQVSHVALYLLLIIECYVGWALAGTFRQPLDRTFFGAARVPAITRPGNRGLHETMQGAHEVVAWILAALIAVHVAAALYHWKVRRDDVLQRMLPG